MEEEVQVASLIVRPTLWSELYRSGKAYGGALSLYFAMEQSFVLFTSFNDIKVIKFIPSKPLTILYSWLF
ncbi:unnamed protein product [Sphagnum troendelagicum]|uniref:Uncharacterized protein n=1 Tax=Sphagnum troendelagicum TaxID=128251 RepID=A0ABP0UYG2_9BRYO